MEPAQRFEQLAVWQKAHPWVIRIYGMTKSFPRDELFGITSQLRRAAASVPANTVEGFYRSSRREKLRYYNVAYASLQEARYFLILSRDLGYADTGELQAQAEEIARMLNGLITSIRRRQAP